MANEITVTASLNYTNSAASIASQTLTIKSPGKFSITGSDFTQSTMSVPTTAGGTAIPRASLGTPGWAMIKNLDATNYVEILSAVAGTVMIRLNANEVALFRFAQGITAPAAIANTAAVIIEYLFLEN
jgi:hypothetical protein